jgi:hypothetical protein
MTRLYSIARFALLLVASAVFAACDNSSSSSSAETEEVTSVEYSVFGFGIPSVQRANGASIAGEGFSSLSVSRSTGIRFFDTTEGGRAFAAFPTLGPSPSAVTVTVDNQTYSLSIPFYIRGSVFTYPAINRFDTVPVIQPPISLPNTQTDAAFSVTGLSLSDSRITIPGSTGFTAPNNNASISKASGLTVRFQSSGFGRHTSVSLMGEPRDSIQLPPVVPSFIVKRVPSGATSVTFTPAELASIPNGQALLFIHTLNMKLINNRTASLSASSSDARTIQLTN